MKKGVLVVTRHAERFDYSERDKGNNWVSTAERPFDPPLSETGISQSLLCGRRIVELCKQLNKPQPTHAYSSPLKRCAETCSNVAKSIKDISHIKIEHGLVESLTAPFYLSWGAPGADSTWGGPKTSIPMERGKLNDKEMHPMAFKPADKLFNTCDMLDTYDTVVLPVDRSHTPHDIFDGSVYNWNNLESRGQLIERLKCTVETLVKKHMNETVLINSHGGPCTYIYQALTKLKAPASCGYTAISLYEYHIDSDGRLQWKVLVFNDTEHVGGTIGGIFD